VLDLSVTGDKSDSARVDPHDPTTTSNPKVPMQSLTNSLWLPTLLEQDLHDQEDQFLYGREERTRIMKQTILIFVDAP
jgi:hypothetical protein